MKIVLLLVAFAAPFDVPAFLKEELTRRGARFSDLEISAQAISGEGDFEITQISYDPVHSKTYFQLRDSHKHSYEVGVIGKILFPTLMASHELTSGATASASDFGIDYRPFSTLVSPTAADLAGRTTRRKIAAGEAVRPEMFTGINASTGLARTLLVEPGRLATLTVAGPGFSVSTAVIPMDAGISGQTVRVKTKENGRILKAVVVDRDLLKGEGQ
jgi:flagella basal body P-ring formation protein FlgA